MPDAGESHTPRAVRRSVGATAAEMRAGTVDEREQMQREDSETHGAGCELPVGLASSQRSAVGLLLRGHCVVGTLTGDGVLLGDGAAVAIKTSVCKHPGAPRAHFECSFFEVAFGFASVEPRGCGCGCNKDLGLQAFGSPSGTFRMFIF